MQETEKPEVDWTHPPPGLEVESLWNCLHDAELKRCTSDADRGSLVLEFDVFHIRQHHHLPEDFAFLFRFNNVKSVRAEIYTLTKTGEPEVCTAGRKECVGWGEFEAALSETYLDVLEAHALRADGEIALRLAGMLDGGAWHEVTIRAQELNVEGSDGRALTLDEFHALGHAYWEAFSERNRRHHEESAALSNAGPGHRLRDS